MLRADEDALVCDLAETYRIFNYRALQPKQVAVLACGLRNNARIKMLLADVKVPLETMMMAAIVDRLSMLLYCQTKDAQRGTNRPESIVERLTQGQKETEEIEAYKSPEEFAEAFAAITGGA